MNKLGIAYRLTDSTRAGYDSNTVTENFTGAWTSVVADERDTWLQYGMFESNGVAVTIVSDGIVLTVSQKIGGTRDNDNATIWVFVPTIYDPTDEQWISIVNKMFSIVRQSDRVTKESFIPLLSMDFRMRKYPVTLTPSDLRRENQRMAIRISTPQWQLPAILRGMNQQYYAPYKHLFIYQQRPSRQLPTGTDDLTENPIQVMYIVLPPDPGAVARAFGRNDIQLMYGNQPFVRPIVAPAVNKVIPLMAVRRGYEPVPVQGLVQGDEMPCTLNISNPRWLVGINRQGLRFVDEAGRNLTHQITSIRINDQTLAPNQTVKIDESELGSIRLSVKANGFEDLNTVVTYQQLATPIRLRSKEMAATSQINLRDDKDKETPARISISGKQINNLPDQTVTLRISRGNVSQVSDPYSKGLIHGILGLAAALLVGWGIFAAWNALFGDDKETEATEITAKGRSTQPTTTEQDGNGGNVDPTVKAENDARDYLNSRCYQNAKNEAILNRDDMQGFAELEGIFDAVNTFNLDKLKQSKFADCMPIDQVIKALEECKNKNINPAVSTPNGMYSNDNTITISKYIAHLKALTDNRPTQSAGTANTSTPQPTATTPSTKTGTKTSAGADNSAKIAKLKEDIKKQKNYISNLEGKIDKIKDSRSKAAERAKLTTELNEAKKALNKLENQLKALQ